MHAPDHPEPRQPQTKVEAEASVRQFEASLKELTCSISPEEIVLQAAARMARPRHSRREIVLSAPHVLVHLVEASCAYWQQWKYKPLDEASLDAAVQFVLNFDDPASFYSLSHEIDLLEFTAYMYRTQLEKQGGLGLVELGRSAWLFAPDAPLKRLAAMFESRYHVTLRQWCHLSFVVIAATWNKPFPALRFDYVSKISTLAVPEHAVRRYFDDISITSEALGREYRSVREGPSASSPLAWLQRRSILMQRPLIKLSMGYVALLRAFRDSLVSEILFARCAALGDAAAAEELGHRYEEYVEAVLRYCLPNCRIHVANELKNDQGGKSCDLVVDLPDCYLLIECKAVAFDQDVVTRTAILRSTAVGEIVGGYEQLVATAERIRHGGYAHLGIDPTKPRYAFVSALGSIPAPNHPAVWLHAVDKLAKRGADPRRIGLFAGTPQTLDSGGLEMLAVCLGGGLRTLPQMMEERGTQHWLALKEWTHNLRDIARLEGGNLQFWEDIWRKAISELHPAGRHSTP